MSYGENQTVVTDKNGTIATYSYNDEGLMLSNTDEIGYSSTFEYNEEKQVISETNPEDCRYEYEYDDNDNQIEQQDPMGDVVERESLSRPSTSRCTRKIKRARRPAGNMMSAAI